MNKYPHGVMFHHFHDTKEYRKCQGSLTSEDFSDLLDFYIAEGHNILSADDYVFKLQKHTLKPEDVCITFDDGLKCQADIALPVLTDRRIGAFWFCYTSPMEGVAERLEIYHDFRFLCFNDIDQFYESFFNFSILHEKELGVPVEKVLAEYNPATYHKNQTIYTDNDKRFRYLRDNILGQKNYYFLMDSMMKDFSYDEEARMKYLWIQEKEINLLVHNGQKIGLHSHTHPTTLGQYDRERQYEEYKRNKDILESKTGETVDCVSYPCGSYNEDTISIMKELGIRTGFIAVMKDTNSSAYELPRENHSNIFRRMR